ncbi:unnamed protein product [Rotaria magnacalcarata]|uniref:PHD finger protein 14 n=4 Tax=Rotaria magnacalcarata TaxID=392030 RepID=A0A819GLP9_9BILA|nr:unnamed protein product [Rotaria magnacalcarata]CAF2129411.1 unnamed protein product [Rotaria magnacalcarata]CAF3775531.1 unnamed protein product [Rotaria magnacalcarata]CAF3887950.1 unnamed protein product [Rotaria magnacalcarata]
MSNEENNTADESVTKPLIAETKICSICLLSGSTDDNDPIVYCDRCGVIVHESCYNADTLDDKSSDSSSPSEYWFCTPCLAHADDPTCALCPMKDNCQAFWPTLESSWVHVVCALGVPGVLFYDELYYTPVDLSNISSQKFGNKSCHLCESRSGVCVSCDAGLCPNAFHLSCANKNGLLQIRGELSKIECELYCVTHQSSSNTYKTVQRNYTICEVQQKQLDHRDKLNEHITQILVDHWSLYKKRSESFPRLPKPAKSHLARSLMVDPVALKNFFDKAQRLRPNQSTRLPNNFDLTSADTNALLAFTANEEELGQIRERITDAENKLSQLESISSDKQLKEEHKKLETELKKEYETLASSTERYNEYMEIFKLYNCQLKDDTINQLLNIKLPQRSSTVATIENDCCSVCKQIDRSNQTIKCCQCHLAFHGNCLTPAMPAKTLSLMLSASKKYDWQCASCVTVQQEELDQCNVNIHEPRQIRPRCTNELVLRETVIKFGSRKRKQDSNFNSNSNNNNNDNEKETIKNKKTKPSKDESIIKSKRTNSKIDSSSSSSSKEVIDTKPDGEKSTTSKSRTSVIKQLFTRKTADFIPESLPKRTSSSARKSSNAQKSPRISIKKSPKPKPTDSPATPVRSKSLAIEHRTPTIFKQKALSVPVTKPEKKKRKTTKDPLSIFNFYDDDENAHGTIELRSSITNNDNDKKAKKSKKVHDDQERQETKLNRTHKRSTLIISNNVPSDARCKECSNQGKNETMTDCDRCKNYYHFICCTPPLSSFPKRRNYSWTCHRCNDDNENESSNEILITSSPKSSRRERQSHNRHNDKESSN